ncbi:MAG: ice-binding family protein [Flavobacteriaceae bacterium]
MVAPTVISTDPENDETDVALNKVIDATFSEPMAPATIDGTTFTLTEGTNVIAGVVTYTGTTASFDPAADLDENTLYTATITTGAENLAGTPLAGDYTWEFTTGTFVAPTVISTNPENEETDVALDKVIDATFSVPMDLATINGTTFTLNEGTNVIAGVVTYTGTTASFDPAGDLDENTRYTATITTGAENTEGTPLASDYIWEFTTAAAPNLPDLGTIENFGGFGGNAGLTNEGLNTVINNGGIGTTAASTLVTGFNDGLTGDIYTQTPLNEGLVTGGIYTAPPAPGTATSFAIAEQALLDAQALYTAISPAAMPGGSDPGAGELGGLVLPPGVYQSASGTFNISNGDLTLDAQGDPNALWVFQTASGLTVGIAGPTGAKSVNLINGANAANVFWQVGSAATINAAGGGTMVGTIVSMQGVTLSTSGNAAQTVLDGRAISLVASVTMVNTTINVPN